MAFENLKPYQDEIVRLRQPGADQKTLHQVVEYLFETHRLRTTPGTLSRFMKELERDAPGVAIREATQAEEQAVEVIAVLTEVLAEVRGRSEEQRVAIEHLAGQVAVNTRVIEELEKQLSLSSISANDTISATVLRGIWMRALIFCAALVSLISLGVIFVFKP